MADVQTTDDSKATLVDQLKSDMSLEDKLAAIEQAMANAQTSLSAGSHGANPDAPQDPQDLLMCASCQ